MAFLSSVTDTKLRAKYHTESYASPRRQRSMKHQDDDLVLQPVQAGILYQGDFDGKIRCMEVFDGRRPLEKLRMWTAEQDGALAIRNAATGEVLCTFEKKKQVFVTCLLYDRGYMYAGLSDGYIRVYRQTPDATLSIFAEPGKMPITLVGDSCTVGRVKALSPAEVAGFCEGMIITHVNGEEVRSAGEIKKALTGHCDVTVKYLTSSGEPDFEIVAEVKKHTGAVTCMVAVGNEMAVDSFGHPVVGGIFTGGRDWQVFLWSWSNGVFHTVYQYPGQLDANKPRVAPVRNAVRCITYEPFDGKYGGLLYTGNDDCYLRAYDFRQGGERIHPGGFPREAHKQGIRSLVVHREHLFSSGLDGYVKVWDSERGVPITTLFSPMDIELRECPQLSLLKANNYVWSGGVDGVIRVWNASGPLPGRNSWKVTELTEHAGSIVTNMCQVQSGADGYMVWSVSDNRIKLLYSESDAASEEIGYDHVQGFTPKEQALINQIEELRKLMLDNAAEMARGQAMYEKIRNMNEERKRKIVEALSAAAGLGIKGSYYTKLMAWIEATRQAERRRTLAHTMFANTTKGLTMVYYHKLAKYVQVRQEERRKEQLARSLLANTTKGLQIIYWRNLLKYVRKVTARKKKQDLAETMMRNCVNGIRLVYYNKWSRWVFTKRQAAKREAIANSLFKNCQKGMMTVYYEKLITFHRREMDAKKKGDVAAALLANTEKGLRLLYLQKCMRWLRMQKDRKKRSMYAELLQRNTADGLRRLYRKKCLDWIVMRKQMALEEKIRELDEKIAELERMLAESLHITDEQIDQETKEIHEEIARLEKEIEELEKELLRLNEENAQLVRELSQSFVLDPSLSESEQVTMLMKHLKAHGCNCKEDYGTIQDCKDGYNKYQDYVKKKGGKVPKVPTKEPGANDSPSLLFVGGLRRTREALAEQSRRMNLPESMHPTPGAPWPISGQVIDDMEPKLFWRQAHLGVKQMIIAWDQMPKEERASCPGQDEVVKNSGWILAIVGRVYNDRKDDQITKKEAEMKERRDSEAIDGKRVFPTTRAEKKEAGLIKHPVKQKENIKEGTGSSPSRTAPAARSTGSSAARKPPAKTGSSGVRAAPGGARQTGSSGARQPPK